MEAAYDRLPLNALRVFEAVAARLNFADAAEALHINTHIARVATAPRNGTNARAKTLKIMKCPR